MKNINRIPVIALFTCLSSAAWAQTVEDFGTSGVQDNGTLTGAAAITADSVYGAGAVSVPSGDANRVQLTQPVTDLDMDAGYTFMTWFKVVSPGTKGLIGLGSCCSATDGEARNGYTMNIQNPTRLRFWGGSTADNSNYNTYANVADLSDGNWHHAAIRVQNGQVDMFHNGAIVSTNNASNIPTQPSLASTTSGNAAFVPHVGGDQIDLGATAEVVIDEVRVYGSVLSDQEVIDAMNNIGALPDRLYYTFDDDTVANDGSLRVAVTKTFTDGLTDEVDVTLTCNGGLPLVQDFTIAGGDDGVTFVVNDLPDAGATCSVTESGGPDGYTPVMNDGAGCTWTGVTGGYRVCTISNEADPGEFTVTKNWVIDLENGDAVNQDVDVTIWCDAEISPYTDEDDGDWYYTTTLGDGDSATVSVDTTTGTASCWAVEDLGESASSIEAETDCQPQDVSAGEEVSCTFTNTVFFEGIPTLSQYGLAILVLLTLGVGMVSFRRFA